MPADHPFDASASSARPHAPPFQGGVAEVTFPGDDLPGRAG